jgi:glycine cleavage system H protein
MSQPTDRRYTESHEWIMRGSDGLYWIGITDVAQDLLGDVVFVGDFKVGESLEAGAAAGVVESVKAVSDVYAPVAGEIVAFNDALAEQPELLNREPFATWIFKLRSSASLDDLLDASAYAKSAAAAK